MKNVRSPKLLFFLHFPPKTEHRSRKALWNCCLITLTFGIYICNSSITTDASHTVLDLAPKNIKLDIFREFQKENQLLDNDQNYTITYSTFVVRFLLLEIQKKSRVADRRSIFGQSSKKSNLEATAKKMVLPFITRLC